MEADCERGLGRPERAVSLSQSSEALSLSPLAAVELQIVLAGARLDLGEPEAALHVLTHAQAQDERTKARIREATVDVLRALGRDDEADELAQSLPDWGEAEGDDAARNDQDVVVYDLEEER